MSLFIVMYTIGNGWTKYIAEYPNEEKAASITEEEADYEFSSIYNTLVSDECEDCGGMGYTISDEDEDEEEVCPYCEGSGSIEYDDYDDMFESSFSMTVLPYNPEVHTLQWMYDRGIEDRTPNKIFQYALEEQGYF